MTPSGMKADGQGFRYKIAYLGFLLGITAALTAVSAALGSRFGWWSFRDAFAVLPWIVYGAVAAAAISLLAAAANWKFSLKLTALALIGLVLGIIVTWIPYQTREALRASPPLSDITTDTINPPTFLTASELRRKSKATNSTVYPPEKAALQATSYPGIKPLLLTMPPEQTFDKLLAAMNGMDFAITSADRTTGHIEAYEQSFWFGFIDDVVVRILATPNGSRVDIRSSSRVGLRDAGMNAKRVLRLMDALTTK